MPSAKPTYAGLAATALRWRKTAAAAAAAPPPYAFTQPRQAAGDVTSPFELLRHSQWHRRTALFGHCKREDVVRLLPHAQVADQHAASFITKGEEAFGEGAKARHALNTTQLCGQ